MIRWKSRLWSSNTKMTRMSIWNQKQSIGFGQIDRMTFRRKMRLWTLPTVWWQLGPLLSKRVPSSPSRNSKGWRFYLTHQMPINSQIYRRFLTPREQSKPKTKRCNKSLSKGNRGPQMLRCHSPQLIIRKTLSLSKMIPWFKTMEFKASPPEDLLLE